MVIDHEKIINHICSEIKKFADIAVLGMSGGADSTLVSILCTRALGKENVYGIHMPYGKTDEEIFNSRSRSIGEKLGINNINLPIYNTANAVEYTFFDKEKIELTQLNAGNVMSRVRMMFAYSFAHHLGTTLNQRVRVIGTGNLSEDFIGYDTKGGDALADIFPIGDLFKSDVYALLDYFRDSGVINDSHIDRNPSAGLWEGQTDEGELGYGVDAQAGRGHPLRRHVCRHGQ